MRTALIALAFLCAAVIIGIGPTKAVRNNSSTAHSPLSSVTAQPTQDPIGTIDGAITPESIPDDVAYALFFQFFSNRNTSEKGRLQAYCTQTALATVKLDALLAAAEHYQSQVAPIDFEARAIRENVPGSSRTIEDLTNLQVRRHAVIMEAIASLPEFLGVEGAAAVRRHIDERIKLRVKVVPGPMMPTMEH